MGNKEKPVEADGTLYFHSLGVSGPQVDISYRLKKVDARTAKNRKTLSKMASDGTNVKYLGICINTFIYLPIR